MKQITIDEYRKKNRRCRTCLYAYQPSGFNARCKAKNKSLKKPLAHCGLRGMFCNVYAPKEDDLDG